MRRGRARLWTYAMAVAILATASGTASAEDKTKVDGLLDYRQGDILIVEGQRLVVPQGAKLKLEGEARSPQSIPLGYLVEAVGQRQADGSIRVRKLAAKPNGTQLFEKEVIDATNELEAMYRKAGQFLMAADDKTSSLGALHEDGPQVDRVRRIVDRVLPPFIEPGSVRVYVIDNEEWNAMAMGNFSIYVFSGLMEAVDDDELAIVLGHEIAHATHEHTRKQQKRNLWIQVGALGTAAALSTELDDGEEVAAALLVGLGAIAFTNGFSRDLEDQADRVGLRYAHEGGYDVSKAPHLWERFAEKYGDHAMVANVLFGDHSRSKVRARELGAEIDLNYGQQGAGARR